MENKKAEVSNIIALCHIIDDFEEFEKRLMPMISANYNRNFVFQLLDISKGKFKLGARKAKQFYNENKAVIDTINKYSNITMFINDNYSWYGVPNGSLRFFYKYISDHKDKIGQILEVLYKLRELGFLDFEFDENVDFTKEIYGISPSFNRNFGITYVDNVKVIPIYVNYIEYGTTDSNYRMELDIVGEGFSQYGKKIVLNSLLFDSKKLPISIDREHIFEHILRLKNEQKEQSAIIRDSVDLNISISDLENQLNSIDSVVNRLDKAKNKDEVIATLGSIRENVEKLKSLGAEYDSSILEQEPLLTQEILERERDLCLKRRIWSRCHYD